MKTKTCLGGKLSGHVLSKFSDLVVALFLVGIFILIGCTKEQDDSPVNPSDTLPQISMIPEQNLELANGETLNTFWEIKGNSKNNFAIFDGDTVSRAKVGEFAKENIEKGIHHFSVGCFSMNGTKVMSRPEVITITVKDVSAVLPSIVSFVANPATITKGDSSSLTWNIISRGGVIEITSVPATLRIDIDANDSIGSRKVAPTVSTIYTLKVKNEAGTVSASQTITVNNIPPVPTREDSISASWGCFLLLRQAVGSTTWDTVGPAQCEKDDTLKLLKNGRFEIHQGIDFCMPGAPELCGDGSWFLFNNGTQISIDGNISTIIELTAKKLTMTEIPLGSSATYKIFYLKNSKKK